MNRIRLIAAVTAMMTSVALERADGAVIIRDFGNGVGFSSVGGGSTQNTSNANYVAWQDADANNTATITFGGASNPPVNLLQGEGAQFLQIVVRKGPTDTQTNNMGLELTDADGTNFKWTGGFSASAIGQTDFAVLRATKNLSNPDQTVAAGTTAGLDLSNIVLLRFANTFQNGAVLNLQVDKIETVAIPEPMSLGVLPVFGLICLRRRRCQ